MHAPRSIRILVSAIAIAMLVAAKTLSIYPGATKLPPPDPKDLIPGEHFDSYLTSDPFEKVVAYYKTLGKESVPSFLKKTQKLPNGLELRNT